MPGESDPWSPKHPGHRGGGEFNIYDEVMSGGAFGNGWSAQKFIDSHWGWKCYALGKYVTGMIAKPDRKNSRRGALVPGITVCDQGIYYKLLKEGDKLARYEPNR